MIFRVINLNDLAIVKVKIKLPLCSFNLAPRRDSIVPQFFTSAIDADKGSAQRPSPIISGK
jgi:hypothetical protein